MKIIVAGASGFLGQSLCELLKARRRDFLAVSRKALGADIPWHQVSDYSHTPSGDVLIYLAEMSDAGAAEALGKTYVSETVGRLRTVLERGFQQVIYISSAMVYGDRLTHPRRPNEKVMPFNVYTEAKLEQEKLVLDRGGLVIRPANVYGPRMSSANVMTRVLEQIPGERDIEVFDAAPVRDYIWHEDVTQAIDSISVSMNAKPANGIFNIGTGRGLSVGELIEKSLKIAGQEGKNVISSRPSNKPSTLILDPSETTRRFGWKPEVTVDQGLKNMLKEAL